MQILFIFERVLYHLLSFVLKEHAGSDSDLVQKNFFIDCLMWVIEILVLNPVQLITTICASLLQNWMLCVVFTCLFCALLLLDVSSGSILALMVNTYNSGIGLVIDTFLFTLRYFIWIIKSFLPLYNLLVWISAQIVSIIALPVINVNADVLPDLIKNLSLFCGALSISTSTFFQRVGECVGTKAPASMPEIPFTQNNLQCFANNNYLQLDLMTPSIYARDAVQDLNKIAFTSCSSIWLPVNVLIYPLLDFNFYAFAHTVVNIFFETTIALSVRTARRCDYARQNPATFTNSEITVQCVPDFLPWTQMLQAAARYLGKLLDNWLDIILILVEDSLGVKSKICESVSGIPQNWKLSTSIFESTRHRVIGMTSSMHCITDGLSTVYVDLNRGHEEIALGNWPFQVNVNYGIAAVQYGKMLDFDQDGHGKTGLFGCACADTASGLQVTCASIPYSRHYFDDDEAYAQATIHNMRFAETYGLHYLTCDTVRIKVSSMRFSKKRMSASLQNGIDNDLLDTLNTLQSDVKIPTYTVDATVVLEPICDLSVSPQCTVQVGCYPFCMGVHVAGINAGNITFYPSHKWYSNLQISQTDCVLQQTTTDDFDQTCINSLEQKYQFESTDFDIFKSKCKIQLCGANDVANTIIPFQYLPDTGSSTFLSEQENLEQKFPSVRQLQQPIAYNGDIFLYAFDVADQAAKGIFITRLWDHTRGSFSLQFERLSFMSHEVSQGAVVCEKESNVNCLIDAVSQNQIVLPDSTSYEREFSQIATTSDWAIHFAVNPDNAIIGAILGQNCFRNSGTLEFVATSSYINGRIWTVKTARLSSDTKQSVYVMNVPNWIKIDTPCDQIVNVRVVDLEYINADNILVTVLAAAPKNYDATTGVANPPQYVFYYLHPNLHMCTDELDDINNFYTCWRTESQGMWPSRSNTNENFANLYGTLCPALRRMPKMATALAEIIAANFAGLQILIDFVVTLPAVASTGSTDVMFESRPNKPTFHSTLDSSGMTFCNVSPLVSAINTAAFHISHIIVKIVMFWEGNFGYEVLQPVAIGTAKVMQHVSNVAPLEGPLLLAFEKLDEVPIVKSLKSSIGIVTDSPASPQPGLLKSFSELFISSGEVTISTINFSMKMFRAIVIKLLQISKLAVRFDKVLASLLYELQQDFRGEIVDSIRYQCDGVGTIFGTVNPLAQSMRHACLLVPDSLDASFSLALLFLVDFATVDCACKLPQSSNLKQALIDVCLPAVQPFQTRYFLETLELAKDPQIICFQYMDYVNDKLLTAYDPIFFRIFKFTENVGMLLDYMTMAWDGDAGACSDFLTSPYIVSIVPEPTDYFQACSSTFDCRVRCSDTYTAFENALEALPVVTKPSYAIEEEILVRSNFFSVEDLQQQRQFAPFEILGTVALPQSQCNNICQSRHSQNKCVAVAGIQITNNIQEQLLAYYCIPASITTSIYSKDLSAISGTNAVIPSEFKVEKIFFATNFWINTQYVDMTIILARNQQTCQSKIFQDPACIAHVQILLLGQAITIYETEFFDNENTLNADSLHAIDRIWVKHSEYDSDDAILYINGTYTLRNDEASPELYQIYSRCLRKTIRVSDVDTLSLVRSPFENCADTEHNFIFKPHYTVLCASLTLSCDHLFLIPYKHAEVANPEVVEVQWPSTSVSTQISLLHSYESNTNLQNILGLDKKNMLYRLQSNMVAINQRIHTQNTVFFFYDITQPEVMSLSFFVTGDFKRHEAWIQLVEASFDKTKAVASRASSLPVAQQLNINVTCSIQNCIGCQTAQPNVIYNDLQAKCYAAAQCSIVQCVGTLVHMQRPLCNMGKAMASALDAYRVSTQALYNSFARFLISTIEISKQRRARYEIDWVDDAFMSAVCNAKDTLVEGVATVTSIFNIKFTNTHVIGSYAFMDSRFHIRTVLANTALTNFLSSLLIAPLYGAIATYKTVQCFANDTFIAVQEIFDQSSPGQDGSFRISLGSKAVADASADVVGHCLSQQVATALQDMGKYEQLTQISSAVGDFLSNILFAIKMGGLEQFSHMVDAVAAYFVGLINGLMDLIAVIDWFHCRPPVVRVQAISQCACNDDAYQISDVIKKQLLADGYFNFWCTGFLLLNGPDGSDLLIYNPYSLHELLSDEQLDSLIACVESASVSCSHISSAKMRFFQRQGAELLQVITRCRENYNQKKWDDASLVYGLFSQYNWKNPYSIRQTANSNDHFAELRSKVMTKRSLMVSIDLPDNVWNCLHEAVKSARWAHSCVQEYAVFGKLALPSLEEHFEYEKSTQPIKFSNTDACQMFSGDMSQYGERSASHSPIAWSPSSSNKVPVSFLHFKNTNNDQTRKENAKIEFDILRQNILHELQTQFQIRESDEFQVEGVTLSSEQDVIHQIVDCNILGPYSSADFGNVIKFADGESLHTEQYYRDTPDSRRFAPGPQTGGSDTRKTIIGKIQAFVNDNFARHIQETAHKTAQKLRNQFLQENKMYCLCQNSQQRSWECCMQASWSDASEIEFGTKTIFENDWNIFGEAQKTVLEESIGGNKLDQDIWTTTEHTSFKQSTLSSAQKEILAFNFMFDTSMPIKEYSSNEILDGAVEFSHWQRCLSFLSSTLFTIPLKKKTFENYQDDIDIDNNGLNFDPMSQSSEEYLHGLEPIIERILARSKQDSPSFWTRVHRYVASDSQWCEPISFTPSERSVVQTSFASTSTFTEDVTQSPWTNVDWQFDADHVQTPTLSQHDATGASHCVCGWTYLRQDEHVCSPVYSPTFDETSIRSACHQYQPDLPHLQTQWTAICEQAFYKTKHELFLVLQIYNERQDSEWQIQCQDIVPSTVWGLLDSDDWKQWYEGKSKTQISIQELLTRGPGGFRLGLVAQQQNGDGETKPSFLKFLRENNILKRKIKNSDTFNFHYQHTIGQPVCTSNILQWLRQDLTEHFSDVFFPMAHSIHQSIAESTCSRWVIEYAILRTLTSDTDISEQQIVEQKWKARCSTQLMNFAFCNLRGIFNLIPKDYSWNVPQGCNFMVAPEGPSTYCQNIFYITEQCISMCNNNFYVPANCPTSGSLLPYWLGSSCNPQNPDVLQDIYFFPVHKWAENDDFMFSTMQWPSLVEAEEIGTSNPNDIAAKLLQINNADEERDMSHVFDQSVQRLLDEAGMIQEGSTPDAFCDDLFDYWHESTQHPVGYHPTTACYKADTSVRGFKTWMSRTDSENSEHAAVIDPIRLRNFSDYSTVFGNAHLTCDSSIYNVEQFRLNPFYLQTKWKANAEADTAVPRRQAFSRALDNENENLLGINTEEDIFHLPMQEARDWDSELSTGIISNWPRVSALNPQAASIQTEIHEQYPIWSDTTSHTVYGMPHHFTHAQDQCTFPNLEQCVSDSDCMHDFKCLKNKFYSSDQIHGVCMHKDTCFQHHHCTNNMMCNGNGTCVEPSILVRHENEANKLKIKLMSKADTCTLPSHGLSEYGHVPDLAYSHGVCGLRSWAHYLALRENRLSPEQSADLPGDLFLVENDEFRFSDVDKPETLIDAGLLQQMPHACDFNFDHTDFNLCHASIEATIHEDNSAHTSAAPNLESFRTTNNQNQITMCDLTNSDEISINGFLRSYTPFTETENGFFVSDPNDLTSVPAQMSLCSNFRVCGHPPHIIDNIAVTSQYPNTQARFVQLTIRDQLDEIAGFNLEKINSRPYRHVDAEECGSFGYLTRDEYDRSNPQCIIDRFTNPLLQVIFGDNYIFDRSSLTRQASTAVLLGLLQELQTHCVDAFKKDCSPSQEDTCDLQVFENYYEKLAFTYSGTPSTKNQIQDMLNDLILQIFGNRGFTTMQDYLQKSQCGIYITHKLEENRQSIGADKTPYRREAVQAELPIPGRSLYFFLQYSPLYVPFSWVWKCLILAQNRDDGGVSLFWHKRLASSSDFGDYECANFRNISDSQLSVHKILQSSDFFFVNVSDVDDGMIFYDDTQTAIISALNYYNLPGLPNVLCMTADDLTTHQVFHKHINNNVANLEYIQIPPSLMQPEPLEVQSSLILDAYEQIWGSDYHTLRQSTLQDLLQTSKVEMLSMQDSLVNFENLLSPTTAMIPIFKFPLLEANIERLEALIEAENSHFSCNTDGCVTEICTGENCDYAEAIPFTEGQCQALCCALPACPDLQDRSECLQLKNFEFQSYSSSIQGKIMQAITLSNVVGKLSQQTTLSRNQALFLILLHLRQSILNADAFLNGNIHASQTASPRMGITNPFYQKDVQAFFNLANKYHSHMVSRQDKYVCSEQVLDTTAETYTHMQALRNCMQNMKHSTGWIISSPQQVLQLRVPAQVLLHDGGFYLTFIDDIIGSDDNTFFPDLLFNTSIARDTAIQDLVCHKQLNREYPETLNPYYPVLFNFDTGCETELLGEGTDAWKQGIFSISCQCFVDFGASDIANATETCFGLEDGGATFLLGQQAMLPYCLQHEGVRPPTQNFKKQPLCTMSLPRQTECNSRRGTFDSNSGDSVPDLHVSDIPLERIRTQRSVWTKSSILRSNVAISLKDNSEISTLQVLSTDISGETLFFEVKNDLLKLKCMHLTQKDITSCWRRATWLNNVEDFWKYQQALIDKQWLQSTASQNNWVCPLFLINAHSNSSYPYSVRIPHPQRNSIRFTHITGDEYKFAHPTASSSHRAKLMPARYMIPTMSCSSSDWSQNYCKNKLTQVLHHTRFINAWTVVDHHLADGGSCEKIIDWPHANISYHDQTENRVNFDFTSCSILDRLPPFAMKAFKKDTLPSISHKVDGPCTMGHLPIVSTTPNMPNFAASETTEEIQRCRQNSSNVECMTLSTTYSPTEISPGTYTTLRQYTTGKLSYTKTDAHTQFAPIRQPHQLKKCSSCDSHSSLGFINKFGVKETLSTNSPAIEQLSFGQPIVLHPARQIAAHLRKKMCPGQASETCVEMQQKFDAEHRTPQNFFTKFLQQVSTPTTSSENLDDSILWNRPWLYCVKSSTLLSNGELSHTQKCEESMTKEEWKDPSTRRSTCMNKILPRAAQDSQPIQFCQINGFTDQFCQKINSWNQQLQRILMCAHAMPECHDQDFFYTPASYEISNSQFKSETVQTFYTEIQPDVCPLQLNENQMAQIQSNRNLLENCAALSLAPIKIVLQAIRKIIQRIVLILYFILQSIGNLLEMLVALFADMTGAQSAEQIKSAGSDFLNNVIIVLNMLGAMYEHMANAIFEIVFRDGLGKVILDLITSLCEFVNQLYKWIVIDFICGAIGLAVGFLEGLQQIIFGLDLSSEIRFLKSIDFCSDESPLECGFGLDDSLMPRTYKLDVATRCWSTYTTFYGDTEQLSCTAADTCNIRPGFEGNTLLCAQCPEPTGFMTKFGCDDATKKCACSVISKSRSICSSNRDCENQPDANCLFLDSDFGISVGVTQCMSCSSPSICFLPTGSNQKYCACTLSTMPAATCSAVEYATAVFPNYGSLCLYTEDPSASSSLSYTLPYHDLSFTPCNAINTASSYCFMVQTDYGESFYYIVALERVFTFRRLLQQDETSTTHSVMQFHTENSFCRDVLHNPAPWPQSFLECQRRFLISSQTLQMLQLETRLPKCLFCSQEDFVSTISRQPLVMVLLFQSARNFHVIITRHTPLSHLIKTISTMTQVIATDFKHLNITTAKSFNQFYQFYSQVNASQIRVTLETIQNPRRKLLDFTDVTNAIKSGVQEMQSQHRAYSSQIATALQFNYPQLSTQESRVWFQDWPPKYTTQQESQCSVVQNFLTRLIDGLQTTANFYKLPLPKSPTLSFRDSWPQLYAAPEWIKTSVPYSDNVSANVFAYIINNVLPSFGLYAQSFFDVIYTLVESSINNFQCDLEAIQLCSEWRVPIINSVLIVGSYFTLIYLLFQQVGLLFFVVAASPAFLFFVLHLSYSYTIFCLPMIPTCLFDDMLNAWQSIFPKIFIMPPSLLKESCSASASSTSIFYTSDCFIQCHEEPFLYKTWTDNLVWLAVELNLEQNLYDMDLSWFGLSTSSVQNTILLKQNQMLSDNEEMITGNRICFLLTGYQLFPFFFILYIVIMSASGISILLSSMLRRLVYLGMHAINVAFHD